MTGERHVEGHLVACVCLSSGRSASPFFKVEGHEGWAWSKGHQLVIGFRHARFNDFHQSTADWEIVNVLRFKVSRRSIRSIRNLPQDIGDLVAHHSTGGSIAMHEQSPLGGQFFLGTIVGIQIHKEPVATHAQLEMGCIQGPFGGQSTRGGGVYGVGSGVRV